MVWKEVLITFAIFSIFLIVILWAFFWIANKGWKKKAEESANYRTDLYGKPFGDAASLILRMIFLMSWAFLCAYFIYPLCRSGVEMLFSGELSALRFLAYFIAVAFPVMLIEKLKQNEWKQIALDALLSVIMAYFFVAMIWGYGPFNVSFIWKIQ